MRVEVDQSGKVEQLNADTIVAFSNDSQYAVLLGKSVKRELFLACRSKVTQFRYRLFCVLVYYCIKDYLKKFSLITIDCEYQGKEDLIKSLLLNLIRKTYKDFDVKLIRFGLIGKQSNAHAVAIDVFRKNRKPNRLLSLAEVEELL